MRYAALTDATASRYLDLLKVSNRLCTLDALHELVNAHLIRIPFENISMLHRFSKLGLTAIPPIAMFLDGVERSNFGGMCFSSNIHFHSLLTTLGFNARLCGADMQARNAHMVVIVTLDGCEYLIDVGYGAPFFTPMRRDLHSDLLMGQPQAEYRLKPQDSLGRSKMEFYQSGVLKHSFLVNPEPLTSEDFSQAIADLFLPASTFRNVLLLTRFWPDRLRVIYNLTVIDSSSGNSQVSKLPDRAALVACIEESFGISPDIVDTALDCVTNFAKASE